jgi:peptide/nickel transport system substrate-binding protein
MKKTHIKLFKRFLFVLAMMFFITACSSNSSNQAKTDVQSNANESKNEGTPQKGGEAIFAYYTDISNFDPIQGTSGSDHSLLWPVYDTLIKFNSELEAQPGLAEKWEFPDDKTLVLTLREGVTFHDGTSLDAEAVKFNIERITSDESKITDLKNIASVEVVDERTVKLNLSQPDSSILLALSDRGGMMVSPTAVQESGADFTQKPVGAGPFKLVNRVPNGEVVYGAYENYYEKGKPYLDKLTVKIMPEENTRINALKSGEIDFAFDIKPGNIQNLENDSNIVLDSITAVKFRIIYLNLAKEYLDNKAVRQALTFGINRDAIIQAINFGKGESAYQPFPSGYWAANEGFKIAYDPNKAKELLKESGLKNITIEMNHGSNAVDQRIAEAIKGQLEEIGIQLDLQAMEMTAATANYFSEKDAPSYLSSWTGRPDPQMTIHNLMAKDSFFNPGGYSTDEIENLISQAASTYDQADRAELYKQIIEKGILEEAMFIPIFFEPQTAAMKKSIKGFESNLIGKPIFSTVWKEQ